MTGKEFKSIFGKVAKKNGFIWDFGGWYRNCDYSLLVFDLQKSNFSNLYYLNIKVFIHGILGEKYDVSKYLIKYQPGSISTRGPKYVHEILDFENGMDDNKRIEGIEQIFDNYLILFSNQAMTKDGIIEIIRKQENIVVLPIVRDKLGLNIVK